MTDNGFYVALPIDTDVRVENLIFRFTTSGVSVISLTPGTAGLIRWTSTLSVPQVTYSGVGIVLSSTTPINLFGNNVYKASISIIQASLKKNYYIRLHRALDDIYLYIAIDTFK